MQGTRHSSHSSEPEHKPDLDADVVRAHEQVQRRKEFLDCHAELVSRAKSAVREAFAGRPERLRQSEDESIVGFDSVVACPSILQSRSSASCPGATPFHCAAAYPQTAAVRSAAGGILHHNFLSGDHGENLFSEPSHMAAAVLGAPSKWVGAIHYYAGSLQLQRCAYALACIWPCARMMLKDLLTSHGPRLDAQAKAAAAGACARCDARKCRHALHMLSCVGKFAYGLSFVRADYHDSDARPATCCRHDSVQQFVDSVAGTLEALYRSVMSAAVCLEAQNPGAAMCATINIASLLCMSSEYDHVQANPFGAAAAEVSPADAAAAEGVRASWRRGETYLDQTLGAAERFWKTCWYSQVSTMCPTIYNVILGQGYLSDAHRMFAQSCVRMQGSGAAEAADDYLECRTVYERTVFEATLKFSHVLTPRMQYPSVHDCAMPTCLQNIEFLRDAISKLRRDAGASLRACDAEFLRFAVRLDNVLSNLQWCVTLIMRSSCKILAALPVMWYTGVAEQADLDEARFSDEVCIYLAQEWRRCALSLGMGYGRFDALSNDGVVHAPRPRDEGPAVPVCHTEGGARPAGSAARVSATKVRDEIEAGMDMCFALPVSASVLFTNVELTHAVCETAQSRVVRESNVAWVASACARDVVRQLSPFVCKSVHAAVELGRLCETVSLAGRNATVGDGAAEKEAQARTIKGSARAHAAGGLGAALGAAPPPERLSSEAPTFPYALASAYMDTVNPQACATARHRHAVMQRSRQLHEPYSSAQKHAMFMVRDHSDAAGLTAADADLVPRAWYNVQSPGGLLSSELVYDASTSDAAGLRCGVHKVALSVLPLCFGSLAAVSRVLKFGHRLNQLFASIHVSMSVEYASVCSRQAARGAGCAPALPSCSASRLVPLHRGLEPARDLVYSCTFVKHMPALDLATLQYLRVSVSCAIVRCCLRCGLPPPRIVGNLRVIASIADQLVAHDSSKPAMIRAVEEMAFHLTSLSNSPAPSMPHEPIVSGGSRSKSRKRGGRCTSGRDEACRRRQDAEAPWRAEFKAALGSKADCFAFLSQDEIEERLRHCEGLTSCWDEFDADERAHVDISAYTMKCLQSVFVILMKMSSTV